jgi:hypothetical protein
MSLSGVLLLAPIALAIDARIEKLGRLDVRELAFNVELEADTAGWTRKMREEALLIAVQHTIAVRPWQLRWDRRGIRMKHDEHDDLVLGVPPTFTQYLDLGYSGKTGEAAGAAGTTAQGPKP